MCKLGPASIAGRSFRKYYILMLVKTLSYLDFFSKYTILNILYSIQIKFNFLVAPVTEVSRKNIRNIQMNAQAVN